MLRIALLLTLALAAVANPDVRGRIAPYADRALAPVYEWSARSRVGEISRALNAEVDRGRPLPNGRELQRFLEQRYPGTRPVVDPWDTPYFLRQDRWEARVGSAGRDRTPGTPDDILSPALRFRDG